MLGKLLSPHGWLFHDENKNTVAILSATLREGMLYVSEPYADVTVFERNGMMLGWIQSDKIITTGDLWFHPKGALETMPSKLRFAVTCPHLSVYGGWLDQDHEFWTCLVVENALYSQIIESERYSTGSLFRFMRNIGLSSRALAERVGCSSVTCLETGDSGDGSGNERVR